MRVEIAQGVVAALGSLNLGLDATRGHFAPVRHLVTLPDEDQGMRWCCDPAAARGLKLVDEARLEKNVCAASYRLVWAPICQAKSRVGSAAGLISAAGQSILRARTTA